MDALSDLADELRRAYSRSRSPVTLDGIAEWAQRDNKVVHVAVMVEPYLTKVCCGEKYIESRLSKMRSSPYQQAETGDLIIFKRSGGPVLAVADISRVEFRELTALGALNDMAAEYSDGLAYEPGFVESKRLARYASLLWLGNVRHVDGIPIAKKSRQAWLTIRPLSDETTVACNDVALGGEHHG